MLLVLSLLAVGCAAPPPRGYYAPEGAPASDRLSWYEERGASAHLSLTVQGIYVNDVHGEETQTVHAQLRVTNPRGLPLTLLRAGWSADLRPGPGLPVVSLPVSEVWTGVELVSGDLRVEAWGRRPFDLFFDRPFDAAEPVPISIRLRWIGTDGAEALVGQCKYARIPPDSPLHPSDVLLSDPSFGLRDGYYMPGDAHLGARRLVPSDEHRLHYPFHRPHSWSM